MAQVKFLESGDFILPDSWTKKQKKRIAYKIRKKQRKAKKKAKKGKKRAPREPERETVFGKVFVDSSHPVVGNASVHLEANEPGRCYQDNSIIPPENMKLDDGS